jgi:UDP-GlcNAc:undecaprenyl-phosphate GlcNAc-1-phosphate transferase
MEPLELAIPLVAAFGVAAVSTPWVARLALAVGAVDRPNDRKVSQRHNMPLLGGLAVAAGFATALVLAVVFGPAAGVEPEKLRGLAIGGFIILVLGVVDDRFGLGARAKLSGQLLAAAIAIYHGFHLFYLTNPFTLEALEVPEPVMWIATAFWIVAITNAVNLLDGLDGLASGVVAIIGTTLSVIAWQAGHPLGLWVGVALVGGLLGFLPHNFSPAKIFLGDTGSLFAGFILSLIALECFRRVSMITLTVPLLTLAVPLLDTSLSIVRRVRRGDPIFSADRMHMHHRLLASEGSARAAVLQFYLLTSAFCLIALSFARLEGLWAIGFLLAVVGLTVRLLMNLGLMELQADDGPTPAITSPGVAEPRLGDEGVAGSPSVGEGES